MVIQEYPATALGGRPGREKSFRRIFRLQPRKEYPATALAGRPACRRPGPWPAAGLGNHQKSWKTWCASAFPGLGDGKRVVLKKTATARAGCAIGSPQDSFPDPPKLGGGIQTSPAQGGIAASSGEPTQPAIPPGLGKSFPKAFPS